jgi:hypothetical protein
MQLYVRARDPRRESLLFLDGRFYRRTDPSRAHAVRRNVVWQSPFGFEIVQRYWPQLEAGTPIRWDARTVKRAHSQAEEHWINRDVREVEIAAREEDERDAVILAHVREPNLEVVTPGEVVTKRDRERWELAVAVAHDREPHVGAVTYGRRLAGCTQARTSHLSDLRRPGSLGAKGGDLLGRKSFAGGLSRRSRDP